jgi:hypothetical protein
MIDKNDNQNEIKVMVVLRNELGEAERQRLREVGLTISWGKGNNVIGRIAKGTLGTLKALPEVVEVEISSPLRAH